VVGGLEVRKVCKLRIVIVRGRGRIKEIPEPVFTKLVLNQIQKQLQFCLNNCSRKCRAPSYLIRGVLGESTLELWNKVKEAKRVAMISGCTYGKIRHLLVAKETLYTFMHW